MLPPDTTRTGAHAGLVQHAAAPAQQAARHRPGRLRSPAPQPVERRWRVLREARRADQGWTARRPRQAHRPSGGRQDAACVAGSHPGMPAPAALAGPPTELAPGGIATEREA